MENSSTAEETVRGYFSALTSGDMVAIRTYVNDDVDVRITAAGDEAESFEGALQKYIHLTEDTEGFQIQHRELQVGEDGTTAWFEGRQDWVVEWEGELNKLDISVSGILEREDDTWRIVQLYATPGSEDPTP